MPTRVDCLTIDAADPHALARFWSEALRWPITSVDDDEVAIEPEGADGDADAYVPLLVVEVKDDKTVQNRVHIDLATRSPEHQAGEVARLESLGARRVDIGQGDVPWVVLADPEGNELCVLEPRGIYAGTGPVASIVLHCRDPRSLAPFWAEATGWEIMGVEDDGSAASLRRPDERGPFLDLLRSPDPKTVKNRLHFDLAPGPDDDQDAEAARLEALGARRVDVGQGDDVRWIVMADPEGNEFCVLTPR